MTTNNRYYILDENNEPVGVEMLQFAAWFDTFDRQIDREIINKHCHVSTVFLGINHNFTGKGKPVVFETMIFGGVHDGYQERYTSYKDALKGHKKAVKIASGKMKNDQG